MTFSGHAEVAHAFDEPLIEGFQSFSETARCLPRQPTEFIGVIDRALEQPALTAHRDDILEGMRNIDIHHFRQILQVNGVDVSGILALSPDHPIAESIVLNDATDHLTPVGKR